MLTCATKSKCYKKRSQVNFKRTTTYQQSRFKNMISNVCGKLASKSIIKICLGIYASRVTNIGF